MTNLEKLIAAKKNMTWQDARAFEDYFIGSLSVLTKEGDWERALATAVRCIERRRKYVTSASSLQVLRG